MFLLAPQPSRKSCFVCWLKSRSVMLHAVLISFASGSGSVTGGERTAASDVDRTALPRLRVRSYRLYLEDTGCRKRRKEPKLALAGFVRGRVYRGRRWLRPGFTSLRRANKRKVAAANDRPVNAGSTISARDICATVWRRAGSAPFEARTVSGLLVPCWFFEAVGVEVRAHRRSGANTDRRAFHWLCSPSLG